MLHKGYWTVFRNVLPKRLEVLFRNFQKKKLIKTKKPKRFQNQNTVLYKRF